jgi:RNA polymerase sigma-70 factor, ECF subfamily
MNCTKEQIDLVIAKCQAVDEPGENFRPLFECYHARVLRYFRAQNNVRAEDCEDLTQEVFLLVYRNIKGFRKDAAFMTWLRPIMRNHLVDYLRKNGLTKQTKHAPPVSLESFNDEHDQLALDIVDLRSNPHEMDLDDELKEICREAINSLPGQMRSCTWLRLQGHTYQKIADRMGLSRGAVSKHLHDARAKIKVFMKQRYGNSLPDEL